MAFTQPCFIRKNTPELRKKLEELGYTNIPSGIGGWFIPIEEREYLVTYPISGWYQGCNGYWYEDDLDCGTNEELFLALAALRDDTDKNQWIIDEANECFGLEDSIMICDKDDMNDRAIYTHYRKATVEEIIKHFK